MNSTTDFRQVAPIYHEVSNYPLMKHTHFTLDNGLKVYVLREGVEPIVSIEFVFKAGKFYSENYLLPDFAAKLLTDGTRTKTSTEIAETLAFYAATFQASVGSDFMVAHLVCLTKHFEAILPLIQEILQEAIYPEKEFQIFKNKIIQGQKVNLDKISFVAMNTFREKMYSKKHPYGFWVENPTDFQDVKRDDVLSFYQKHIQRASFDVFIAGNFNEKTVTALNNVFGKTKTQDALPPPEIAIPPFTPQKYVIERPNSSQAALRIGMPVMKPRHPDYFKFLVLNEIFGGYFGSRIMRNIREDKGYTYGIHSNLMVLKHSTLFSISTQVNADAADATLFEVDKEIKLLINELVGEAELSLVKNTMIGGYVSSITTPYDVMEKIRTMILNDFPMNFYDEFVEQVRTTTAEEIQAMAQKYFTQEMLIVTVG
jgi:predicted Zn-dependent peptidase